MSINVPHLCILSTGRPQTAPLGRQKLTLKDPSGLYSGHTSKEQPVKELAQDWDGDEVVGLNTAFCHFQHRRNSWCCLILSQIIWSINIRSLLHHLLTACSRDWTGDLLQAKQMFFHLLPHPPFPFHWDICCSSILPYWNMNLDDDCGIKEYSNVWNKLNISSKKYLLPFFENRIADLADNKLMDSGHLTWNFSTINLKVTYRHL